MILVPDTHALVWYLHDDARLGREALRLLEDPASKFAVPTIVLCELHDLSTKRKLQRDLSKILQHLKGDPRFDIVPLDETVVAHLPDGLDIHDAIIVGTTLALETSRKIRTALLTRDEAIRKSSLVETVWD